MCFLIDPDNKTIKIAEQDIFCYKAGSSQQRGNEFVPYYRRGFTYIKDDPTPLVFLRRIHDTVIDKGYHSYKSLEILDKHFNTEIVSVGLFIIPKNTEYYENDYSYVSSRLTYLETLYFNSKGELIEKPTLLQKFKKWFYNLTK